MGALSFARQLFTVAVAVHLLWTPAAFARSAAELQAGVDSLSRRIFWDVSQYAEQLGCGFFVGGSTLLKMMFAVGDGQSYERLSDLMRAGQDIDVLIECSRGKFDKLNDWLNNRYPEYRWDTGLRRQFESDGFKNQNTDSLSTTFLKLATSTEPARLLDLKKPDYNPREFLEDVIYHRIHFHHSELHEQTAMFLKNKNPAIFSVLRYFIHLATYELTPADEDIEPINRLIAVFNVHRDINSDYSVRRALYFMRKIDDLRAQIRRQLERDGNRLNFTELLIKLEPLRPRLTTEICREALSGAEAFQATM